MDFFENRFTVQQETPVGKWEKSVKNWHEVQIYIQVKLVKAYKDDFGS